MNRRKRTRFHPNLERFEDKQLLSLGAAAMQVLALRAEARAEAAAAASNPQQEAISKQFKLFRITDTSFPVRVSTVNPLYQVLVQTSQPVPGQLYNVLELSLRNGTKETFTAADNLQVKITNNGASISGSYPILTGNQAWPPNRFITFYILTKKYYPLPQVNGGFTFSMVPGAVAIPGPAGIILRIRYNPATFPRILDYYVDHGPGPEYGTGLPYGLPVTSIWEFTDANNTNIGRNAPRGAG